MIGSTAEGHAAAERRFVENMQRMREDRGWSQSELARRMVDAGWEKYTQMTVSRTEKFDRPLRLSEAATLAALLGSTPEQMMAPEAHIRAVEELKRRLDALSSAEAQLHLSNRLFQQARHDLQQAIAAVERVEHELTGKSVAEVDELLVSSVKALAQAEERQWPA